MQVVKGERAKLEEEEGQVLIPIVQGEVITGYPGANASLVDQAIAAWLHEKQHLSNSEKTFIAYRDTLTDFREFLREQGYDLFWTLPADKSERIIRQTIALCAQAFANTRAQGARRKGPVRPATQNQRYAILSSFYQYANKRGFTECGNPIELVDRARVKPFEQAIGLEPEDAKDFLHDIDPHTTSGLRNMTLLLVLMVTGRRANEVASLRWKHVLLGRKKTMLHFERCKGGEELWSDLDPAVTRVLLAWLHHAYGGDLTNLDPVAPLWINLANDTHYGQPLGYQGIAGVCKKYLGTSKVHITRHTFALLLQELGAKLTDIQRLLGHKNAAVTSLYLEELQKGDNPFASQLAAFLDITVTFPQS